MDHIVSELMAKVENITGLRAVNQSVTTGKTWTSGDSMAVEVSANDRKYFGGLSFSVVPLVSAHTYSVCMYVKLTVTRLCIKSVTILTWLLKMN